MSRSRLTFRCNLPPRREKKSDGALLQLATFGSDRNVNLLIEDIAKIFLTHLEGRTADVIDIAAFIYAADSSISRSGAWTNSNSIEPWGRELILEIGVRDLEFWIRAEVQLVLKKALSFLADDAFELSFYALPKDNARQDYLNFGPTAPEEWPFQSPDRVLLFSGGLDSLAGATINAAQDKSLVLVCHRSVSTIDHRQQQLFTALKRRFANVDMLRVPVWVNKTASTRKREYTQRTRSFLFWAIALAVGKSVGAAGMTFFENGVVSLNLPVADQVLRARASRTTHPMTLQYLRELAELVLGRSFEVDNPFIFKTKTEVIQLLLDAQGGDLIRFSCSCSRTYAQRSRTRHCGCCSQCIDRRLSILAANAAEHDPDFDYGVDVLTGARGSDTDRAMAFSYVRHSHELALMPSDAIAERFNAEISRAAGAFPDRRDAAHQLISLHTRHGKAIRQVIAQSLSANAFGIFDGQIAPTSLLGLTVRSEHLQISWVKYAERLTTVLYHGLPRACQTHKPRTEIHLQEICDGLLTAAGEDLTREYPYLRWASRLTKPDWKAGDAALLVELKYVRSSDSARRAGDEIAADITKYRDSESRVLFVIYDPDRRILDERNFVHDIERHEGCLARIVR